MTASIDIAAMRFECSAPGRIPGMEVRSLVFQALDELEAARDALAKVAAVSLPATTTDSSEDRIPLCDACSRETEREWSRQAKALLRRMVETWHAPMASNAGTLDNLGRLAHDVSAFLGGDR